MCVWSDLSLVKHVSTMCSTYSAGSVRSAEYVDHSTQTPQRLMYTLSLRLVSTTVTPCWLGRQGPSPTGFNGWSTRQPEWSLEPGSLSQLLYSELHWLDIPQSVQLKLEVTVHLCLQNKARLLSTWWTAARVRRMCAQFWSCFLFKLITILDSCAVFCIVIVVIK